MNRKLLLFLFSLVFAGSLAAQSVSVEATIDSTQILIGEQANIEIKVAMDANQRAIFPMFPDTLVKGIEVLEIAKPDTQYLNDNKRIMLKQRYTITSVDAELYYIPPLEVLIDEESHYSKALALKVYSMPVDTLNPDQFFGPKDIRQPDFVWADWYLLIALLILLAPFAWALVYLGKRLRDNEPIIRKIKVEPKRPAHEVAIEAIQRIKEEKIAQKEENPKLYYTELTDAIRTYIMNRFGFNALEMTSGEIVDQLKEMEDAKGIAELKELFQTADLVKFAKHKPLLNENDANLVTAVEFINETKEIEEENKKPEPTEITVVEQRPLRTKVTLIVGIVALALAIVGSIIYISKELYGLF